MRRRLPSISALTCFEAASRHESFTLAAEELGITQGSANRQVRELERLIGVRLFRREGRAVRLTDAGVRLAGDLGRDLHSLERTVERAVVSGARRTHISIGVPPTFAAHWLVPRLARYLAENPDVTVSVRSYTEPFDMLKERIDLAIHYGTEDWPGGQLQSLCPEDVLAVVSGDLARQRAIVSVADLNAVPPLYLSSRPTQWDEFRRAHNLEPGTDGAGTLFDQFSLVISGAISGMGAALIPSYFIEKELADGTLRMIAPLPADSGAKYYLVTPSGQCTEAAFNLAAWLRREGKKAQIEQDKRFR